KAKSPEQATLEQLLCDVPLHSTRIISDLFSQPEHGSVPLPDKIHVHCDHERCGGERRHTKYASAQRFNIGNNFYLWVAYRCENCESALKVFGLKAVRCDHTEREGLCAKIYQEPAFGEPIPKRLFDVIGEENREPFLQARRAIARGLGIGAYAY